LGPQIIPGFHEVRLPPIILSFDDADQLAELTKDGRWSIFSKIRRALYYTGGRPIFSIFLSKTFAFNFREHIPKHIIHPTDRIIPTTKARHPILTEVGFDELAYPIVMGETTLEQVSDVDFMSHYGRPL
jgi:hypothetical protein